MASPPGLQSQTEPAQPQQPLTESQDVLAKTARDLVTGVDVDGLAIAPKIANSKFMHLIRQLGQGKIVVQDPPTAAPDIGTVGEGAKLVPRADWVGDFVGGVSTALPPAARAVPSVQRVLEDQDVILMTDRPGKSVHFDTGPAAMGSDVPTSLAEAVLSQASVPGATSAWEDDSLDDDLDVFLAYNGTMQTATRSTHGAAEVNGWDELAEHWQQYAEGKSRVTPGMGQGETEERYLFQAKNPYGAESLVRETSPTVMGVLELEAAVRQTPQEASAWLVLGLKQQENEREDAAILALSKAVQLDPENEDAHLALAVSYTNEGEKEAANTVLERWIELRQASMRGGKSGETGAIGDPGVQASSSQGLVDRLVDMARARPDNVDPNVQIALGVLFNASEDYTKAEDCFLAALSVRPNDWLLYNRLGATLANGGRPKDAIEYYHRALSLHPNFVRALFNLGIAHTSLGQHATAAQCVLDALRLQQADASEGYVAGSEDRRTKGVTSESLWSSLRSSCLQLDRTDLVLLTNKRELAEFPLHFHDFEAR
ncbi:hypothetical protein Q5752_004622 [Cryptotrichosporon argae]